MSRQEEASDVSREQMFLAIAQHFELQKQCVELKNWDWVEVGNFLSADPYRICGISQHSGVMWGRKGGSFIWQIKYSPDFSGALKDGGEAQFQKAGGAHWRSRPRGTEGANLIAEAASKHFLYLVDTESNELWMSREDKFLPAQGSNLYELHSRVIEVTKTQIYNALSDARLTDDLVEKSLKICDGTGFVEWPDDEAIELTFSKALFFIQCEGLQPRYFEVDVQADGAVAVADIAFGSSSGSSSRMIARFREGCGGRLSYVCNASKKGDLDGRR